MIKNSNPILKIDKFDKSYRGEEAFSANGVYNKTAVLFVLCFITASFTFAEGQGFLMITGLIAGLILAIITTLKKEWAPITAPLYAVAEGAALGGISFMYAQQTQGIVTNAILATLTLFLTMLFLFRTRIIKVTEKLRMGIMASMGAIFLLYLISMVLGFFGHGIPFIHDSGPLGIGFSLLVLGIASFSLLLDFDFIETVESRGGPKYLEWYAGFGLMVSLVWIYLEVLRLLSKLNRR